MTELPPVMLVTGATGEIGGHLARHFLGAGWVVLGLDKREADRKLTGGLVFRRCDLVDGHEAAEAIDELVALHGAPSVLVNCAGRIANAPLVTRGETGWTTHDAGLWNDVVASSLTAAFHVTSHTVKHLLSQRKKGVVINVSSICADGNAGQSAYSAAKAGLDGFTRAVAKELGPLGIRVVGLAPGYFDTQSMHANVPASRLAKVCGSVPLRRLGVLDEIVSAVEFLIRNEYMNGTILEIDGGLVL